jgi:hypothetical protein
MGMAMPAFGATSMLAVLVVLVVMAQQCHNGRVEVLECFVVSGDVADHQPEPSFLFT